MSAVNGNRPTARTSATEPITEHVDVYLEGERYLRTCIEVANAMGIPRAQPPLSEAISFCVAEQEVQRNTWICCLCQGTYTLHGFHYHVCSYEAAIMTATLLEHTVPLRYVVADSITALQYLRTGALVAHSPWALLMWKLVTQHVITLFLTCSHEVDLPMQHILDEALLEPSMVAENQMLDTLQSLVRELEEHESYQEEDMSE